MRRSPYCPQCRAVFRTTPAACPRDGTRLVNDGRDPMIGTTLADRYVIERMLAEGGMGRVYEARHRSLRRRFAIKVLFGDVAMDPKMQVRFAREADSASRLAHPNVVGVIDFGDAGGLLYLAMDLVPGQSLGDLMRAEGVLDAARTVRIVRQIAEGLAHAHGRGLVHRDFKPDNVMIGIDDDGTEVARIVDFGIALTEEQLGARVTTDGSVIGTPFYMAPEQATGGEIDHRVDLYALGVVLYEMLAGVLPFDGDVMAIVRQHVAIEPPPIARRVPGLTVDPVLEDLALRLMAKSPDDRPQTARDVVALLVNAAPAATWSKTAGDEGDTWEASMPPPGMEAPPPPTPPSVTAIEAVIAGATDGDGAPTFGGTTEGDGVPTFGGATFGGPTAERTRTFGAAIRQRRAIAVLAIAIAVVVVGIGVVAARGRDGARTAEAPAPIDAAPSVVAIAVDAGVVAIDAAPAEVARIDPPPPAGTTARPPRGSGTRPATTTTTATAAPPPADAPITIEQLTTKYTNVGRALDRALARRGEAAVAPLRRRYLDIPYLDALRKPEVRDHAWRRLITLERDLARLAS